MNAAYLLSHLPGTWTGTSRLFLPPDVTFPSRTEATISTVAQGRFIHFAYFWAMEGKPQNGLLIFPAKTGAQADQAVWLDSWHMRDAIMVCKTRSKGDTVILDGSYAAPPGPDWGWRIEIAVGDIRRLHLRMYNIRPGGKDVMAVDAAYELAAKGT